MPTQKLKLAFQESPWTEPKGKKAHARYTTTNGHTKEHKFSVGFYERDRVATASQ